MEIILTVAAIFLLARLFSSLANHERSTYKDGTKAWRRMCEWDRRRRDVGKK
jgi:hypothetical protein